MLVELTALEQQCKDEIGKLEDEVGVHAAKLRRAYYSCLMPGHTCKPAHHLACHQPWREAEVSCSFTCSCLPARQLYSGLCACMPPWVPLRNHAGSAGPELPSLLPGLLVGCFGQATQEGSGIHREVQLCCDQLSRCKKCA